MQVFEAFLSCGSICTDTRSIVPGSVFFALKGVSFNGNTFALQALEAGAAFAVVDENVGDDERLITVNDVLTALQQCALDYRRHLNIPTIGLTGSNGKTTTKELFLAVLKTKYKVHATKGNFNNHIGVPLTILSAPKETGMLIVEMGGLASAAMFILFRYIGWEGDVRVDFAKEKPGASFVVNQHGIFCNPA